MGSGSRPPNHHRRLRERREVCAGATSANRNHGRCPDPILLAVAHGGLALASRDRTSIGFPSDLLASPCPAGPRVLSIVGQLVARNTDLERRVARLAARFKPSEQVSTAQLVLFLDALKRRPEPPAPEGEATDDHAALMAADDELRVASGIDEGEDDDVSKLRTPPPPRQPRSPTPPAHLRRVDHRIDVPAAQRACPTCGGLRRWRRARRDRLYDPRVLPSRRRRSARVPRGRLAAPDRPHPPHRSAVVPSVALDGAARGGLDRGRRRRREA
jgi:hypothetical protein